MVWRYQDAPPGAHGVYVRLWRQGKERTRAGERVRLSWAGPLLDAAAFDRVMRAALDVRISAKVEQPRSWRKLSDQWQQDASRDCADVRAYRTRRIVVSGSGLRLPEMQRRFPDIHARFREGVFGDA